MRQLEDSQLATVLGEGGNSMATVVWHVSGNLASRFTDFLTSDGEKPWRDRQSEFATRSVSKTELLQKWESGWKVLWSALGSLNDDHALHEVAIRGEKLSVQQALHRSLAHTAYHVGQMVLIARSLRGAGWEWLSSPPQR